MRYIILITLLLSGCSTKGSLDERRKYANICQGTNVQTLVEADREITCYPDYQQVRLVP